MSCDTSCDHSHMSLHCLKKIKEIKTKNKIKIKSKKIDKKKRKLK